MVASESDKLDQIEWEEPNDETLRKWYAELGMTEQSTARDIRHLKEWIHHQPHLPNVTDDRVFETFLFNCKNSLESAKVKLDQYYTARATVPEYFADRDPQHAEFKEALSTVCYVALPRLTPEGYRVCVCRMFDKDVAKFKPIHLFKGALMFADLNSRQGHCRGMVVIFDLQGRTMAHVASITYPMLKNFFHCALSAFPTRMKGFHIVNAPTYTNALITLSKGLLKDKIRNRIHTHSKGVESLSQHLPKSILPPEYGGTYTHKMTVLRDLTVRLLVKERDWFLKEESVKADLSKKPAKNGHEETSIFGIEGSFRTIGID